MGLGKHSRGTIHGNHENQENHDFHTPITFYSHIGLNNPLEPNTTVTGLQSGRRGFFPNNFLCKLMGLGKHSRGNRHENHENPYFHGKLDVFTMSSYMLFSHKNAVEAILRRALFYVEKASFW